MVESVQQMVDGQPAPHLRPFVERYVGYRIEGMAAGSHRGLPSRHLTIIISLARPVDLSVLPNRLRGDSFSALVGGLHASPVIIEHDGSQHGLQLELTPIGARALLGVPASALASTVVHLSDLLGRVAGELVDRLTAAAAWPARFCILDEVLTRVVTDVSERPPEVAQAWRRLVATRGTIEVGALAHEIGWSRRHLGERFRQELGLTPKVAARVLRFEHACDVLKGGRRPALADLAVTCGYFDQAHMTRDWHDLAGCAPTTWIREELLSVQDERVGVGAS
ncbi:MAG: helix-turn-helix domain-containing protein [Actinomycetota bacterium]|nr:helix-turn-helix domain-containing protein [Actinomycetota bacterium]